MLKKCLYGGVAAALLSMPVTALAQPVNDACASATTVVGLGSFPFTTIAAVTGNPANSQCNNTAPGNVFNDVWFRWVANFTGSVRIGTCGGTTADTKIAVYHASVCPPGPPVECADDTCGLQSEVGLSVVLGETYTIRIGGFAEGNTGAGTFSIVSGIVSGPLTNPANSHRYYLLGPDSWTNARTRAIALGGNLATINDAAENAWVLANVVNKNATTRNAWIGFNDAAVEAAWVWSNGETPGYTNWQTGQPDNFNGIEDYTTIDGATGKWYDRRDLPGAVLCYGIVEINAPARLADFNGLGGVTVQDIYDFLSAFSSGSPLADVNGMGGVTVQDVYDYLELWVDGCP